jgi:uracil-DNA glycosylase family 4
MSSPGPSDRADQRRELAALLAGFRTHLEARARSGLLGVPVAAREARAPAPAPSTTWPERKAQLPVQIAQPAPAAVSAPAPQAAPGSRGGLAALRLVREELGEPFVGAAGQLLTRMIAAMGFSRADVYICNVIKCRPPYNRNPEPDEVAACEPFLKKQLAALAPRMIVALGKFAAQALCRESTPITRLRGNLRMYEGIPVMPTYHPAYLLRTPEAKRQAWQDLQTVLAELARMGVRPPNR